MHAANQIPTTVGFVIATPQSTIAQDSNLLAHAGQYSGGISVSLPVRFRQALSGLLGVILLGVCQNAHAFSLTFQGLVRALNTGSITLISPAGTVVDLAGDLFVSDTGNNRIIEINAQGVASVLTIGGLSPALSSPSGLALDGAGNLYIADTGNSRVVSVTPAGAGSVVSTGSVTLSSPRGVALDTFGDIFIADTGNNRIAEVTSGGSAAVLTITVSSGTSTLSSPKGLAVSNSGKLYIADSGNNRIVTVAAGSTTGVVASILGGVTLSNPSGVVVDSIGNVYVADTANNRIAEIDTSSNGTVLYTNSQTLNGPLGLAADAFGTVYVADTGGNRVLDVASPVNGNLTSSNPTYSLNQSVVGFGHVQLGSSSAVTLTLPFTTGSVGLGAVKVFTFGVQNLDFTAGSGTTCNSSTPASTSCSVEVSFLPTKPGLRSGAVVLYNTSQNPILTLPLYGFADSPVAALAPNTGSVISTGAQATVDPYQIALDGAGNMYVGDYIGNNVAKVPAGGGSASLVALGTPASVAVQDITGVALDGAGNLFIADHLNSRILVVTPGGVVSVLSINGLSSSIELPTALAFDLAGNLYIADYGNGRGIKVTTLVVAGSTSSGLGTVVGTGSYSFAGSSLTGMTVDSQGNIYFAAETQNNSSIIKVTPSGAASALPTPGLTPAISDPQGVAVDAMGNIYIVDTANSRIVKITNAGLVSAFSISGLTSPTTLSSSIFGVTVDPSGNLYIPDWTNNRLVFVNVSGAALKFASTNTGSTSSDSPKTATVTNLGDQPLVFSTNPTYTADFSNSSADNNPCTSSTSLQVGAACDVAVKFTPQTVGSLSAGITVTDDNLNVAGSTQQVSVSGTAISSGDTTSTTVTISPSSLTNGQTATLTATVANTTSGHTSTVPTGSVTFTDTVGSTITSLNGGSAVSLSAGIATLTGVRLSGLGTHTITASYGGVSSTYQASSNVATVPLSKPSVTITGPAQPVTIAIGQAGSVTITVAGSNTTLAAPTGTLSYSILNSSGTSVSSGTPALAAGSSSSTASIAIPSTLASGTYTINVTYSGDSNYLATSTATAIQFTIGQATPTIGLTSTVNPAMATIAVTFTASVASSSGTPTGTVSFLDGTTPLGAMTLSGGAAAFTTSSLAAGTHTITAVYAGDANFAAVTSSPVIEVIQDFSLSPPGSGAGTPTQTVLPGGTATYPLIFGPISGTTFPNTVTLSVSGLPPGATATITPNTIPAGSPQTNVSLTIQLPQTTAKLLEPHIPPIAWCVLLLPFARRLRRAGKRMSRTWSGLLLAAVALAVGAGVSGCGSTSSGFFGHPQQTYSVVITATSGSISHSTTVALIVQ